MLGNTNRTGDVQADTVWPPHQHRCAHPCGVSTQVQITTGTACQITLGVRLSAMWMGCFFMCLRFRMVVDNWSCKLAQWMGRQEFVVPANVLGLVYGQTVVWTGALFCPLLPLINTVKFVILFYCKKVTQTHNTHDGGSFHQHSALVLFQPCSMSSMPPSLLRSHWSITVGQLWGRFAPPPPPSFSWWSSRLAGAWPQ